MKKILITIVVTGLFAFACNADCCNKEKDQCKHESEQNCEKHADCQKAEKCKDKANCKQKGDCKHDQKCHKSEESSEIKTEPAKKDCDKISMDKCGMKGKMGGKKCGSMKDIANTGEEQLIYYTCPMESHKHIGEREAGKCKACGMELVPGVITTEEKMEFWGCPMPSHSEIRLDKPGRCEDCGMKLMPMRLDKQ
jgi:hypothetical protein